MPDRPRNDNRFDSRRRDENNRKIEWQRTKNNLLGILVAIIVIAFAFDLGGIATSVANYLFQG